MAWETQGWQPARADVTDVLMQESQRTFMSRVYGWMFAGLMTTGVVALLAASSQQAVMMVAQFRWVFLIAQLGLVFALSALAPRLAAPVAGALFLVYSVLTGLTFSVLFYVYTGGSIANAFLMAAGTFGAMSVYGAVTKKDLSAWGTFLFMGLIGVVIASVVQIFVQNSMLNFVLGCAGVVLFAGLAAYDTQKLREMHAAVGYKSATSASINGALVLYLDFINLFISLLRLFGDRRDD
ncbi:membrane protein [Cystobacter fuscus]|uniref:Membrane protein n=1 Tax=Cystobacter fuscus TaxID=43 RepID=A0A250JBY6_9BACT|nr:Bax inhibitor-1/YccA family protein [Cystobacter fuscus]ATB41100.1 membrane protein [Cystobacter fuscus]